MMDEADPDQSFLMLDPSEKSDDDESFDDLSEDFSPSVSKNIPNEFPRELSSRYWKLPDYIARGLPGVDEVKGLLASLEECFSQVNLKCLRMDEPSPFSRKKWLEAAPGGKVGYRLQHR